MDTALEHSCLECLLTNLFFFKACLSYAQGYPSVHMTQLVFDLKCIKGHFAELYLLDLKFFLPLLILYCEFPKWKKGSVQCALQAFQAISLLP